MNTWKEDLLEQKKTLEDCLLRAEQCLIKLPSEFQNTSQHLIIDRHKGTTQYYLSILDQKCQRRTRKYLKKSSMEQINGMIQAEYYTDAIRILKKRLCQLTQFLSQYDENALMKHYLSLQPERQQVISPLLISDEEFVTRWEAYTYKRNENNKEHLSFITERGELVRSKSEKIIADKLASKGIPYRYECPLTINRNKTIHPDFTILNVRLRQEIYYEHFGMMDEVEYCEAMIKRVEEYIKNGFYPGETLVYSMETKQYPLQGATIDRLIQKYFI